MPVHAHTSGVRNLARGNSVLRESSRNGSAGAVAEDASVSASPPPLSQPAPIIGERLRLEEWRTHLGDFPQFAVARFDDRDWRRVAVPHNWEDYHGYRVVSHGNLHGTAWYRTSFEWSPVHANDRLHAFFEGVGSYATVYVNGAKAGEHAGGRTTFTVDLTAHCRSGRNVLAVRAHHPAGICDLPFVCGGCWGSPDTEGSQPFGMSRPAWLEATGPVRLEPFGVHVVTLEIDEACARIEARTSILNPDGAERSVLIRRRLLDPDGRCVSEAESAHDIAAESEHFVGEFPELHQPRLWCPEDPALYSLETALYVDGRLSHRDTTTFGLRWLEWPVILDPQADHNVVCADRRGEMLSSGEMERTPANNGLTHILHRDDAASVGLAPMGARIMQCGTTPSGEVLLQVALNFQHITCSGLSVDTEIFCEIQNDGGTIFLHQHRAILCVGPGGASSLVWAVPPLQHVHRWSERDPYLHRLLVEIRAPGDGGTLWERSETVFGIRPADWDAARPLNLDRPTFAPSPRTRTAAALRNAVPDDKRVLRLNGRPIFLNGTCEYETLLGCDHAFTDEQVAANVAMMRAAGFNAFRDAHHPHNLRYYHHWDRAGMLCWTQMGSHIWFDTPEFRANFRTLVTEWVKERRNHPCIMMWGLENESTLPEDFAMEMRDLIRRLDPSSPAWRLTTTCNGGKGSDWNVPQEWSGTYGGNCNDYDLRDRQLVGEYGAWRSFGVHTESSDAYAGNENDRSETWACHAMETKIRLGEEARNAAVGHFHWLFNSFPNPGRTAENYEGPDNGQIGPINNKGMVTAWHQPSDLYYLYRANYADPVRDPMVYIVSHTAPDRWKTPGPRRVSVYSNCEEVELFNGMGEGKEAECRTSYGTLRNPGRGRHFSWEAVEPRTNILRAVGRMSGRDVAEDIIRLHHLPEDPAPQTRDTTIPRPHKGSSVTLVNCGSPFDLTDAQGRQWSADQPWTPGAHWGWESWGGNFDLIADDLASHGYTLTPVRGEGSASPELYRNYRYGRQQLKYHFRTGPGRYRVRCHFAEPWFGVGGAADCRGWRLFDIAINDRIVEKNLDVWTESAGDHRLLIRTYDVEITEDCLTLHFPRVAVNQALIFAIEVQAVPTT